MIYNTKMIIAGNVVEIYTYEKAQRRGAHAYKSKISSGGGSLTNEEERKLKDEKNIRDAVRRTKQTLRRSINANAGNRNGQKDKFFTLTYAKNMMDLEQGNKDFRSFIKALNYRIYRKHSGLKYVCVVEKQERGAIHYHVIFFNLPYIPVAELTDLWGHGYTSINAIDEVDNVGAYVVKYMTKTIEGDTSGSAKEKGKKMYFSSRNLEKPTEVMADAEQVALMMPYVVFEGSYEGEYTGKVIYQQANLQRQQEKQD